MYKVGKKEILNVAVLLYFLFLILTNQVENYVAFAGFYASLVFCGVAGMLITNYRIAIDKLVAILLLVMSGTINAAFVGNTTANGVFFMCLFAFASVALACQEVDERILLIAFILNVIVIAYKIATVGVMSSLLFTRSSRNYVSVYLMYPLIVYYTQIERSGKAINLIPAIITWVLCLISRGRGGIISGTLLLLGIYVIKYKRMKSKKRIIATIVIIVAITVVLLNATAVLSGIGSSAALEMFERNGLESSRMRFWPEYIDLATSNTKNFLLGVNITDTQIGRYWGGNPHNSFIELHMLNGIIGLGTVLYILFRNIIRSFKSRNYLFIVCTVSIMIRAFTDHVLWASFGTPILFYLMQYQTQKDNLKEEN